MDGKSLRILLGAFAEQQYLFHLLTTLLVEKKILSPGELDKRFDERDKFHFSHDLLEHLVSIGLRIDENSPSSSSSESPASGESAATEAAGPGSETKS
jgi:hypothetical protein